MIAARLGSSAVLKKEAVKLFSQTLKLATASSSNILFCKHVSGYGCSIDAVRKRNYHKHLENKFVNSLRLASLLERSYAVNAASIKETEDYRNENNITITGEDVPDPIQQICNESFPEYILKYLKAQGIEKPTTIQAQGWPIVMSGKNLVGIAQTGTGKTLAYLLPAIKHIKEKESRVGSGPIVLILAPTRELARQIQQVAHGLSRQLKIRTACIYGGANKVPQARELENGVDIVIATPGRLIDFLTSRTTNLDRCTYLVLDEADRMLDMGFEPQIRRIFESIPLQKQILMWSATWPKEVQALAQDYLGEYVQVNVGSMDLSANRNIKQELHFCDEEDKFLKLNSLLQEMSATEFGKVLIFANMKRTVEDISRRLRANGWPAVGIHGDKSQVQRDSVIYQFKQGKAKIMVASDVAARGLDVDGITHVINYDYPMNTEDYIHRIGRTGRSDCKGTSHTLLTEENARQAGDLIAVLKEAHQEIPEELIELSHKFGSAKGQNRTYKYGSRNNSYNNSYNNSSGQRWRPNQDRWNRNRGSNDDRWNRNRGPNEERNEWKPNRNKVRWDSDDY